VRLMPTDPAKILAELVNTVEIVNYCIEEN
jgi:hypothetical protein